MKTCATCLYWLRLGSCATARAIMYDNRAVSLPPGDEGQCRALPPATDNRWPMTMAGHWCGQWRGRETLTEDPILSLDAGTPGDAPPAGALDRTSAPAGGSGNRQSGHAHQRGRKAQQ